MLCNLHFFSSKCRLFHNATLFGFCITHILNTGCAKIWKKKSVAKRLKTRGNQVKPVSRWPVAGPSEYWLLASSPAGTLNWYYSNDFISKINEFKGIFVIFFYTQWENNQLQSPFWEANQSSSSEVTRSSLPSSQPATFACHNRNESIPHLLYYLRSILMLIFHLLIGISSCFLYVFL